MKKNPVLGVFILLLLAALASADEAARLKMDLSTGEFYVNMPKSGTNTLNISAEDIEGLNGGDGVASFKLYDDAGKDNPYSYRPNGTLHIVVPEGYFLQVMGQMNAYNANLGIYEGELCQILSYSNTDECYNAVNILYQEYSNVALKDVFARSSDNSVSINFYDNSGSGLRGDGFFGLDLTVQIISKSTEYTITCAENVVGGSCPESKKAKYQDNVSLTVTPESGYVLADIEVKDADGTPVSVEGGKWYSNTASFQMPPSNVTITPKFTKDFSNLYFDITPYSVQEIVVPTGVTTFKAMFKGSYAYQSGDCFFLLRIIAPENHFFRIQGGAENYLPYGYSTFSICQGDNCGDNAVRIFRNSSSDSFEEGTILYSSGENANVLTFDYQSSWVYKDVLNFMVTIADKDADYTVTCAENTVGGVCSGNQIAKYGDSVTITATPADGFVLSGVEVKDADGNLVDVEGGKWYSNNTASFKMQLSNVTVTPTFTDDLSNLYINMPADKRTIEVVLPPIVTSFKVYDDGGKDGNFAMYAKGGLHLVAPEGNIVQVTGRVKTFNYYNDGISINDNNYGELYSNRRNKGALVNGLDENILLLSSSNDLNFQFSTSSGDVDEGVDLKVTVGEKNEHTIICQNEGVVGGTIACPENKNIKAGEDVTLTASPETGYVFTGVEIKDANGKVADLVVGVWGNNNTVSFPMPLSDVTVTPLFTNDLSNFDISMSYRTNRTVIIPPGVTTFKAYDNGGKDGSYSIRCDDVLSFVAPEEYLLKVTGSANLPLNKQDTLLISSSTENLLKMGFGSKNDIALLSSGREMIMRLYSSRVSMSGYGSMTFGFDFTIDLVENTPHKVTCANVSGGVVDECSEKNANFGQKVKLTAKPDNTVLKGVEVLMKDNNIGVTNNVVNVTGGTWYNNTFSFNMPYSDVTVKPVFGMPTNLFVNLPQTGSFSVNVPLGVNSFKVFDDGGVLGNYSASADGSIRLIAPNSNYIFRVKGHMKIENGDALSICEGNSCDGSAVNLIKDVKKEDGDISLFSSGNTLTVRFKTSYNSSNEGFDLTVDVIKKDRYNITCNSVEGGSIRCPANDKINAGRTVTMNAIAKSGYILTGYEARNADGSVLQSVDFPWYSEDKVISFSMPANDVSVMPKFTKKSDLYINMPTSGTLNISSIPTDVTLFHVYDDGGAEGDYSEIMNSTLKLNVPDGKLLVVSGSIEASESSELKIYDGFLAEASYVGSSDDVGYVSANPVSISFTASSASSMAGIDLVVNVVENVEHAIACGSAENGELACDKDKAKAGDLVTLTASPAEGYVLSGIEVKDADGNAVKVEGGKWYSNNTASFKMPVDGVTVMPVFAEAKDLYVNMPTNGDDNPLTVYVPTGVTTFKVYDDGGKDGPYSKNKIGKIYLFVPVDDMIRITGSLEADQDVYLEVGDNATSIEKSGVASADLDFSAEGNRNPYIRFEAYDGSVIGDEPAAGLDLTVTLVNKKDFDFPISCNLTVSGGTYVCDKTTAKPGEIVQVTATPSGDNKFVALEISGFEDNEIFDIEFDGNTVSFPMPRSRATVNPMFVSDVREFFVNMGSTMRKVVVSPELLSFHVYDGGGKDYDYWNYDSTFMQLIAPKGYNFMVSGTASIARYDYVTVYDGGIDADKLADSRSGVFDFNAANSLKTSGNVLTIYFYSNDYLVKWGFDFTVNVGQNEERSIACGSADGGIFNCEKTKANAGELIKLTSTPADGYMLDGVEVKDVNQNVVAVEGGKWYSFPSNTEASFAMPFWDVTVTPSFSKIEDLFVYMPTAGKDNPEMVYVPEEVTSFKVYSRSADDVKNKSGCLQLVVPEDNMVLVTGSMQSRDDDQLDIGYYESEYYLKSIYSGGGSIENIDVVLNADKRVYICYNAGSEQIAPIIDLTVNLVKKTDYEFSIVCADGIVGGSINCLENNRAKGESTVELTATPEGNNILAAVEVYTKDESVEIGNLKIMDNKISFTMPLTDVMLRPLFVDKTTGISLIMPASGTKKLALATDIPELNVYDDGGKEHSYSNSVDGSLQLIAPEGYLLKVSGTAETESDYDYLTIFDGEYGAKPMLSTSGTIDLNERSLISTSNVVTILLKSDGSVTCSGLDIKVSILKKQEHTIACGHADGGTLACSRKSAYAGKKVRLKATTEDGYVFVGADVKTANGNVVNVTSDSNTAWFYMPYSDVIVTPKFLSKSDEFVITMPTTGWDEPKIFNIPKGMTSFKVYDDGGKDANYGANSFGILQLNAPKGSILRVTGSVDATESVVWAFGYNSDFYSEPPYWGNGTEQNINFMSKEDGILGIYFNTNTDYSSVTAAGLDLTVTVMDKKELEYSIACDATVNGGTFSCDKTKGKGGEVVKLTANPAEGYEFVGVSFVSPDSSIVIDGVVFEDNIASFAMPYSNVSVKPIFTDKSSELYVNMPTSGMNAVSFAAGVTSFKVYDDGGVDENYSKNVKSFFQLIAPNNYLINLFGTAKTEETCDTLSIYEGGIGDSKLVDAVSGSINLQDYKSLTSKILTLEFGTDYYGTDAGLDFTVDIVENSEYSVACVENVDGGTVACDKDKAKVSETVTLTAMPAEGYILDGVEVKDADGRVVKSFAWYSHPQNTVSFKMPISNVTVVPSFTKLTDLTINIAMTENPVWKFINIPEVVKSFKIHDCCSDNSDERLYGMWQLNVPQGYKIFVSGSIVSNNGYVSLSVYDKESYSNTYGYLSPIYQVDGATDNVYFVVDGFEEPRFYFGANYSNEYATSLDLTVRLVKPESEYAAVSVELVDDRLVASIDGDYNITDAVDIPYDIEVDEVSLDREFSTDGAGFSTIMLPFDIDATNLVGVKSVIEFNGIFALDGNDAVGMRYVWCNEEIGAASVAKGYSDCNQFEGKLKAYTPYMVEMESKTIGFKGGVTIKASRNSSGDLVDTGVRKGDWVFRGVLQKKVFTREETKDGNVWGYAGEEREGISIGKYVQFGKGVWVNPLRAYLLKSPEDVDDEMQDNSEPAPKASFVISRALDSQLDVSGRLVVADRTAVAGTETASIGGMEVVIVEQDKDGNAHTTVIGRYDSRTGEIRMNFRPEHTYDLKGRRVKEGRKAKGAYYGKNVKK